MSPQALPTVQELSSDVLATMLEQPDLQLLDVRTQAEYDGLGHLPNALLLPIEMISEQSLASFEPKLDPEKPLVVICEHGVRSAMVSQFLVIQGFQQVYNYTYGMAHWSGPREFGPRLSNP